SFEENSEKSLILRTAALRSLIHSISSVIYLSSAQNTAELSLQSSAVSLSSLCREALMQSLTNIITYLHCAKQLKKRRILYTYLFSHFYYFHCICNNNFYLSISIIYSTRYC
ncbi:uncharacterized protein BDCG_17187, partial [Blastomyces dermatitidis ER-3]